MNSPSKLKEFRLNAKLTQNELAKKTGISQQIISNYENGTRTPKISVIRAMAAALRISMSDISDYNNGELDWDDHFCKNGYSSDEFFSVPVISQAAALSWDSGMIPLMDYIDDKNTDEKISFPGAKPGDHAVKVVGDSMAPWYPEGTYVLVRPNEKPHTGKRVIAKLITSEIVFKVFIETETQYILKSINQKNGKDLIFDKNKQFAFWIWPIKWSFRNEDELDREMINNGIKHEWQKKSDNVTAH